MKEIVNGCCARCGHRLFTETQLRGNRKLSLELARVIRDLKARQPKLTTRELGRQFDVSHVTIRLVLAHRMYPESREKAS